MKEILFTIGPLKVHGYGFMIAIGIILAFLVAEHREKTMDRYNIELVFDLGIISVIGGWTGSKILFWITEYKNIIADPSYILSTLASGWVVYGGLIGGILTGFVVCKVKKQSFLNYADLVLPVVALAQSFGRIGCLLAGCCYGAPTDAAWGIVFKASSYAPNGIALIPTQIISSAADLLNFIVLSIIMKKTKIRGITTGAFLCFYSIGRFLIEYLRDDPRGSVGVLSTSQFIAIVILIIGILTVLYSVRANKKQNAGQDM